MVKSQVVKVTGMSEDLLRLLDARVKQQQATGRAEYIRELIRRDALASPSHLKAKRHKTWRRSPASSPVRLRAEYHALVDLEMAQGLTPAEQARLRAVQETLDRTEASETQMMLARMEETAGKLDALLAAVQSLPKAET